VGLSYGIHGGITKKKYRFAEFLGLAQEFRNWAEWRWQKRGNRVLGRDKSLRGVKNAIRGIFAIGFSGQKGRGTGAETTRLLYPWKGEAERL